MKYFALMLLLISSKCISAQDIPKNDQAPQNKYEVSILTGRALNADNFEFYNFANYKLYFNSIHVYQNFNRWQLGVGLDVQLLPLKGRSSIFMYHMPNVVINRTAEFDYFSFYAGAALGYVHFNSKRFVNSIYGRGIITGLQTGIIIKFSKVVTVNGQIEGRIRQVWHKDTDISTIPKNSDRTLRYNSSQIYIPLKIGLRVRI